MAGTKGSHIVPRGKTEHAEQIIQKPREVEGKAGRDKTGAEVVKTISAAKQTCFHRRKKSGCHRIEQVKRIKEPEKESARVRRLLAHTAIHKAILSEAASGNF